MQGATGVARYRRPVFVGHFGLAFGAKRLAPQASLGALFAAAQLADLVWPVLVLAGVERVEIRPGVTLVTPLDFVSYPYSHSLTGLALWAALFSFAYWLVARRRPGAAAAAVVASLLVVSHWLLDWLTHRPDLPLTFTGADRHGLGLWNSLPATLAAELGLYAAGVALYLRSTRARDRVGSLGLGALVVFLAAVWLASVFGPPPPSPAAVAGTALSMWLLVAWGAWIDRHREASGGRA